jgi:hypothetical protein
MKSEIIDHLGRQFDTLDGVFERVDDKAWRLSDQSLKGVWQWMAHTLETIEFYMSEKSSEAFDFGGRFGVDWEDFEAAVVPTVADMQAYCEDVKPTSLDILKGKGEDAFSADETVCPWTGSTYGAKMIYMLRHTQQHIGDMNRVLAVCGCRVMDWH